jgi:hypothetical protein
MDILAHVLTRTEADMPTLAGTHARMRAHMREQFPANEQWPRDSPSKLSQNLSAGVDQIVTKRLSHVDGGLRTVRQPPSERSPQQHAVCKQADRHGVDTRSACNPMEGGSEGRRFPAPAHEHRCNALDDGFQRIRNCFIRRLYN